MNPYSRTRTSVRNAPPRCASLRPVSTRSGAAAKDALNTEEPIELSPEDRADLEQALAEADEDERQGRLIPAADFLARLRRAG